ncbi:MAG TPA: hypothetical protein VMU86_07260, partial [Steroidobacteraceae bacterium]|nr:hypothetical protein [Steroidobacteraceae bacterium]
MHAAERSAGDSPKFETVARNDVGLRSFRITEYDHVAKMCRTTVRLADRHHRENVSRRVSADKDDATRL